MTDRMTQQHKEQLVEMFFRQHGEQLVELFSSRQHGEQLADLLSSLNLAWVHKNTLTVGQTD